MKTAVVAIGGNAILRSQEEGTMEEQRSNVEGTVRHLVDLIQEGYEFVVTHGNGPQVGAILLQNEEGKDVVPPMPLDVCGAETQGQIGYLLQQAFTNEMRKRGIDKVAVSIVTQVVVREEDRAFSHPTKYIGPYYTMKEKEILEEKGWTMKEDPRGGFRRVVPSPEPVDIIEKDIIKRLVFGENRYVVIAAGGGGIPVIDRNGAYEGVEAVIDKDLASGVLASSIGEKLFILLTDVPHVSKNFGKQEEEGLFSLTAEKTRALLDEGHFPPGSMGPKIKAALCFLEQGGERVLITSPEALVEAIEERDGTWIIG
ncbi:MAG: carbamate kinase [Thermoplasmata archaeon]|nr:carbamate kinase [Thermoplasmata archaeon]